MPLRIVQRDGIGTGPLQVRLRHNDGREWTPHDEPRSLADLEFQDHLEYVAQDLIWLWIDDPEAIAAEIDRLKISVTVWRMSIQYYTVLRSRYAKLVLELPGVSVLDLANVDYRQLDSPETAWWMRIQDKRHEMQARLLAALPAALGNDSLVIDVYNDAIVRARYNDLVVWDQSQRSGYDWITAVANKIRDPGLKAHVQVYLELARHRNDDMLSYAA